MSRKISKVVSTSLVAVTVLTFLSARSEACIFYTPTRGDNCSSGDSLSVEIVNRCGSPQKVWICLKNSDQSWSCGLDSELDANDKFSNFICHAFGSLDIDVVYCDVGTRCDHGH